MSARASTSSIALVALLALPSCGGGRPDLPAPRLVMVYATCTLNRSFLGPYAEEGQPIAFTPALDEFASESVVFERHQSESGQSGISFASIFSGTQADRHGIYTHPNRLPDELYLVTEAFRDAGYDTYFWSGHEMAAYDLNYGQGVPEENVFLLEPPGKRQKKWSFLQSDDALFRKLLERLRADPDYRAFVLVNFSVTHGLYDRQIPDEEYGKFLLAYPGEAQGFTLAELQTQWKIYHDHRFELQWDFPKALADIGFDDARLERFKAALDVTYRADVNALDGMFGRTLDQLAQAGVLDQSVIAFTADHGETFCREGTLFKWTHGLQLAPEVLSVPWIVRAPMLAQHGFAPGRYAEVTRSIDVYPTVAGLCGIDVSGRGVDGTDLSPALLGLEDPPHQLAYSHTTTIGPDHIEEFSSWGVASIYFGTMSPEAIWACVRDGDTVYKWRNLDGEAWGPRVHDLAKDPHELVDLYDASNAEHARMIELVKAYRQRLIANFDAGDASRPDDSLERLRNLGYVEGGDDDEDDATREGGSD